MSNQFAPCHAMHVMISPLLLPLTLKILQLIRFVKMMILSSLRSLQTHGRGADGLFQMKGKKRSVFPSIVTVSLQMETCLRIVVRVATSAKN